MPTNDMQIWDLWIADVGATGISFARSRLRATDVLIVHAAPEKLNVEVRNSEGPIHPWPVCVARKTRSHGKTSGRTKPTMVPM